MPPPDYHVGTAIVIESLLKRKWSVIILRHLANGVTDPVEISKREVALSPAAVNERLRNMLRYGLISRYRRLARPKSVRYRATPRGYQILEVLNLIEQLDQQGTTPERPLPKEPSLLPQEILPVRPARKNKPGTP
jgi:DNA-binding HxlR family transcriptional regulator